MHFIRKVGGTGEWGKRRVRTPGAASTRRTEPPSFSALLVLLRRKKNSEKARKERRVGEWGRGWPSTSYTVKFQTTKGRLHFLPALLSFTISNQTHKCTSAIQWRTVYVAHIEVSDSRHFKDLESHFSLWSDCFVRVTNLSWLPRTFLALDLKGHVPENPLVLEMLGWLVIWLILCLWYCRRKRLPP